MNLILPLRFYADHEDRGLPTPRALKRTARQVTVRMDDPALPELLSDAEHYAHADGPDDAPAALKRSAKTTAETLRAWGIKP